MLPAVSAPPTTAPTPRRPTTGLTALPPMASTASAAMNGFANPPAAAPPASRQKTQPAGGAKFRSSKYFVTSSPRSLSPQNLTKRRTPSPQTTAGGDALNAVRVLSLEGDDGPPAMQGSRLRFASSLDRDTSAGGPVYGAGSFKSPQELGDFLVKCDIDVSAWNEGEAKGVHGLHRELEKLEATLCIEDRRLIRSERIVRVRAHRPGSTQHLVERRTNLEGRDPSEFFEASDKKKKAPKVLFRKELASKIDLWQSAAATIFATKGTMLAGNAPAGEPPADTAQRLANGFAQHAAGALGLDSPAARKGSTGISTTASSSFIRSIAAQLEQSGDSPFTAEMVGLVQEAEEYALMPAYPGLVTRRSFHEYALRIPILPAMDFTSQSVLGSTEVTHHWEWHDMMLRHEGLVLTPTQLWLLEALFAGCSRVEVTKLHPFQDEHSDSLLLRTNSYDVNGEPDEPTVTKIAQSMAIVTEREKTGYVLKCGVDAVRVVRQPIYAQRLSRDVLTSSDAKFDAPLRERLGAGTIRLLKCSWLMSDTSDEVLSVDYATGASVMLRQKDLPREAFFSREEAVSLLDRGDRSVFVVSQVWQTTEHPDPHGNTLYAIRRFLSSDAGASTCGLFWDWTGLGESESVGWQSEEHEHNLVLPCYASFTGTTVLLLKNVPPRPAQYDGLVMLFGLAGGMTEDALVEEASEFGQVLECEIMGDRAAVHFSNHAEAEEMVSQFAARKASGSDHYRQVTCHFAYDSRPYDGAGGRGWSIFEQAVCMTAASHVAWAEAKGQLPRRFKLAQETRPKVVDISNGATHIPTFLVPPDEILTSAIRALEQADFTIIEDMHAAQMQLGAFRKMLDSAVPRTNLEDLGAMVLEMGEACWTLPEYGSRLAEASMITTLKEQIMHQLYGLGTSSKLPIAALRDLWGPGGPLNRMSYKTIKRGMVSPTDAGGLIDQTLHGIVDSLSSALFAPESSWSKELHEVALGAGFTPSPPTQYSNLKKVVQRLLDGGQHRWIDEVHSSADEYANRFQHSFALDPDDGTWSGQMGGESLIDLVQLLDRAKKQDEHLRGIKSLNHPLLLTYAHKSLNLENIVLDAAGSLWMCNFVDSGFAGIFEDAVKITCELLFESFPVPFTMQEVKNASVERLTSMFQLSFEAAGRLKAAAEECDDTQELSQRTEGDDALKTALARIAEKDVAEERANEVWAVLETLLAPIHAESSDVRRVPTLLQLSQSQAPASWSPHAKLILKLITTIVEFSYELCAKCSQIEQARSSGEEGASYLEQDLHVAHFLLPLLRLSLQSLYDRTLSLWQKRVAWRASQMLAAASCEVLRRPAAPPPKYSHRSKNLKLANGQLISLRTSESRIDGGAGSSLPLIVGESGKASPTYDSCSHVVLPWTFAERGGAAAAVIECGGLHDYQVELPILSALIKKVPVPPHPSLCMKFDISVEQMTEITTYLLSTIEQVQKTCQTPAVRKEVDAAFVFIEQAWAVRCQQREKYEAQMEVEINLSTNLVKEINLLQGERWRMEKRQREREVEIVHMREKAIESPTQEKARLDQFIGLERRKILKFKQRLTIIKQDTRRRILEQAAAEKEADAAAARAMTVRMTSTREETLEEQANRERYEANLKKRRKEEDSKRQRLAEEETREKAHIQKKESESRRALAALQQECAQADMKLRAAKEIDDKVRYQDGQKTVERAWLAVDIQAAVTTLRTLDRMNTLDMSGSTKDQKFDDLVKGELKPFATRHPKITALLRKEVLMQMEEEAQQKEKKDRKERDPFVDKLLAVRTAVDEYDACNIAIEVSIDKEMGAKTRQTKVASDEAKLRQVEMSEQTDYCHSLAKFVQFDLEQDMLLWCSAAISEQGSSGARDYAEGQQLIVRCQDGIWRDAVVLKPPSTDGDNAHSLLIDSDLNHWEDLDDVGTEARVNLDPFNHAPREIPITTFDVMRSRYLRFLRSHHATVLDPLTGTRLDITKLRVPLELPSQATQETRTSDESHPLKDVSDAYLLTDWLQKAHAMRCDGDASARACMLLVGKPASGKTCLMSRIVLHLLDGEEVLDGNLVPIFIHMHDLQRRLLVEDNLPTFGQAWNWIDAYMQIVHGADSETYSMLRQALMARRALLLLDGIDEGGVARDRILRHVTEVLAPQGHMLVLSSRPAGLQENVFAKHFHQLRLCPLPDEHQAEVVNARLSTPDATKMMKWIKDKLPPEPSPREPEESHRLTANPLMLTLLISLFEHMGLQGKKMPTTLVETYETACSVMLQRVERKERGAIASKTVEPHVSRLLEAVFLEAHNSRVRVVEEEHLEIAALSLVAPEQLKAVQARESAILRRSALKISCQHLPPELAHALFILKERMLQNKLPVLRLLQADPLQMISHLSFQEYYTARAICRGIQLEELPWRWSPWWSNVLKMGLELGDQFGSGLLRSSGVLNTKLDLNGQLPRGERPLALDAIVALVRSRDSPLTCVDLSGNRLEEAEMYKIGMAMLSNTKSQITGITADSFNLQVTSDSLEVPRMRIRPEGFVLMAGAIRANTALTSLDVSENYMVKWAGEERNRLVVDEMCGVEAMAQAISNVSRNVSCSLKHIDMASNALGAEGAAVISSILTNRALKSLSLRDNKIGDEGVEALSEKLAKSHLTSLDLSDNSVRQAGVKTLAEVLKQMNTLTELNFAANHLLGNGAVDAPDLAGVKALGKAIASSNLKYVDLSACQLCGLWDDAETGKHAWPTAVGDDSGSFTLGGLHAIAEALATSKSLTALSLYRNQIEMNQDAKKALEAANKRRATLAVVTYD